MFDSLYADNRLTRNPLHEIDEFLRPPATFRHGKWEEVARLPKNPPTGDGSECVIFECRLPARFYKLEILPGTTSVGERKAGWSITTGSGDEMGELIVRIAKAVTEGMIGFHPEDKP